MNSIYSFRKLALCLAGAILLCAQTNLLAQGRGGARGGTPGRGGGDRLATVLEELRVANYGEQAAVDAAQAALARAALEEPAGNLQPKVDALAAAQLKWANAQARLFAEIQASENKLTDALVAQLASGNMPTGRGGGGGGGGGGGARGGAAVNLPNSTPAQVIALGELEAGLAPLSQASTAARAAILAASFVEPANAVELQARIAAYRTAELSLANARTEAFARLQASTNKLTADQIQSLISQSAQPPRGAGGGRGNFGGN